MLRHVREIVSPRYSREKLKEVMKTFSILILFRKFNQLPKAFKNFRFFNWEHLGIWIPAKLMRYVQVIDKILNNPLRDFFVFFPVNNVRLMDS